MLGQLKKLEAIRLTEFYFTERNIRIQRSENACKISRKQIWCQCRYSKVLQHSPHYKYEMAMWKPNMSSDEEAKELVLRVHFYGIRSSGGLYMAAVKKMI